MAIQQGYCQSFKVGLLTGTHNFASHTFKIALYTSSAILSPLTTVYTSAGEVVVAGYTAGGANLAPTTPALNQGVAIVDFADVSWSASITARGALVYNASAGNAAVCVLDFGMDRVSQSGVFTVRFPPPTMAEAIIRL